MRELVVWVSREYPWIGTVNESMVLTDVRKPDCPIVQANIEFEMMTEYSSAEILGRNCRFLQGAATNRATVTRIRNAVANGKELSVEILNYTKHGVPFVNAFSMYPVHRDGIADGSSELCYFLAIQKNVTHIKHLPTDASLWTPHEVVVWLERQQLLHLTRNLVNASIDGRALLALTDTHLAEHYDITDRSHIDTILDAVRRLQQCDHDQGAATPPPVTDDDDDDGDAATAAADAATATAADAATAAATAAASDATPPPITAQQPSAAPYVVLDEAHVTTRALDWWNTDPDAENRVLLRVYRDGDTSATDSEFLCTATTSSDWSQLRKNIEDHFCRPCAIRFPLDLNRTTGDTDDDVNNNNNNPNNSTDIAMTSSLWKQQRVKRVGGELLLYAFPLTTKLSRKERAAYESVAVGVAIISCKRVMYANSVLMNLTHYEKDQMIGMSIERVLRNFELPVALADSASDSPRSTSGGFQKCTALDRSDSEIAVLVDARCLSRHVTVITVIPVADVCSIAGAGAKALQ
jgi:PAS domain-containing protein